MSLSWSHGRPGIQTLERAAAEAQTGIGDGLDYRPYESRFLNALEDDMNTPEALQTLTELADDILSCRDSGQDASLASEALSSLASSILGLQLN